MNRVWGFADRLPREKIVSQFNVVRTGLIDNETTPLQVGNGNFAFNVDNTGLQVRCDTSSDMMNTDPAIDVFTFQYSVFMGMAQRFTSSQRVGCFPDCFITDHMLMLGAANYLRTTKACQERPTAGRCSTISQILN